MIRVPMKRTGPVGVHVMKRRRLWGFIGMVLVGLVSYLAITATITSRVRAGILRSLSESSAGTGRFALSFKRIGLGDILGGRIRGVRLIAENAVFEGMRYRRLQIRSDMFVVDRTAMRLGGPVTVTRIGPTIVEARIDESDINRYRAWRWPNLPADLILEEGIVRTRVRVNLAAGPAELNLTSRLTPIPGGIRLQPELIRLGELIIPRDWVERAVGPIDRLLALDIPIRLPVPVEPKTIRIRRGWLEITLSGGSPGSACLDPEKAGMIYSK